VGSRGNASIPGMSVVRLDSSLELVLERLASVATPCVVATIVATTGSTYRKAGARMLIEADGRTTGLLSGGCFEQDLREHAHGVLAAGAPRAVEYDMRDDDDLLFGIGAGCEGALRILLETAAPGSLVALALKLAAGETRAGRAVALAVVHEGPPAALGTRVWSPGADGALDAVLADSCAAVLAAGAAESVRWQREQVACEAWIQYLAPPPRVLICGAGADAEPVVAQLRALKWPVTVIDHRAAYADPARFAGAAVIKASADQLAAQVDLRAFHAALVMSHHLASDAAYLRALAASAIPYLGLLGPRARRERLLAELGELAGPLAPRLRSPVGLDLGAETPEGIALAITAELHAFAAGRDGGPWSRPGNAP
jgi:xanthine/CO dehydrogenase XdhC/CoxF family maturation factor